MPPDPAYARRPKKGLRIRVPLLTLLVFAIIALARITYVSLYAAPVPFWDQWDELDRQIRPWFSDAGHFMHLFAPHGEHRIFFTRVISLLLAATNSHVFDNLVEAYANAFIYAVLWAILYTLLVHHDTSKTRSGLIALAVVMLGVLPFDWENTLIGFQNQFYIMALLTVTLVGISAYRALSVGTVLLLTLLAVASLFTMGSGLLAAPAVCFCLLLCAWHKPGQGVRIFVVAAIMMLVTALGLAILHHVPGHDVLRAQGTMNYAKALLVAMMWPLQAGSAFSTRLMFAAILWTPSLIWLWFFLGTRRAESNEIFAVSLAGWVFLQCLAIAYSRGHNMFSLPSRYSEITAIGIAANLWLALKLVARRPDARWTQFAIGVAVVLVGWIFWQRTSNDLASMRQRHVFTTIETQNVQRYLAGLPLPMLPDNSLDLPYPKAQRLRALLDNREIRALLPPSLLPPTGSLHRALLSSFAARVQATLRGGFPKSAWSVGAGELAMLAPSMLRSYTHPSEAQADDTQCALDVVNGQAAANASPVVIGSAVTFGGWMGNGQGNPVGTGILILEGAQQSYAAPFTTGVSRPDVAKALHSEAMAGSGYNLTTTLDGVKAGAYSLFVADPANPTILCDLHRTLTVH